MLGHRRRPQYPSQRMQEAGAEGLQEAVGVPHPFPNGCDSVGSDPAGSDSHSRVDGQVQGREQVDPELHRKRAVARLHPRHRPGAAEGPTGLHVEAADSGREETCRRLNQLKVTLELLALPRFQPRKDRDTRT